MTAVLRTRSELREWRAAQSGTVGFVPTMGALHAGHASLVERAVSEQGVAIASIFVNPTQFAPGEDYLAYPRDELADLALIGAVGAAAAFVPRIDEIYPEGDGTRVVPGAIAARFEGERRPGHFTGVATVVTKLLALVEPDAAYFGQKDYQQLRVIQTIGRDLGLAARIVGCPIVREADGLALSSRNAYLSATDRAHALALSRGLFAARDAWEIGERDPRALHALAERIARDAGDLDYVSVADPLTLAELASPADRAVVLLAARVGKARLIDNVLLGIGVDELA